MPLAVTLDSNPSREGTTNVTVFIMCYLTVNKLLIKTRSAGWGNTNSSFYGNARLVPVLVIQDFLHLDGGGSQLLRTVFNYT